MTLSREGFSTPLIPLMPWSSVDGIALTELRHRGHVVGHNLSFRVLDLDARIEQMGLFYRLRYRLGFARRNQAISLPLRSTSEHPDVLCRTARLLWKKATGRSHEWDPMFSPEANRALRESDQIAKRLEDRKVVEGLLARDPVEVERMLQALQSNSHVLMRHARRKMRLAYLATAVGLLALLVVLLGPFLSGR